MSPQFEVFSKYWASPILNLLTVVVSILILYPIIYRITYKQLSGLIEAINTAKTLPTIITQLTDAGSNLENVKEQVITLKNQMAFLDEKMANIERINESLEKITRNVADLQTIIEAQDRSESIPASNVVASAPDQVEPTAANEASEAEESITMNWQRFTEIWAGIKEKVEEKIASIQDGRKRRKYNVATRYTYDAIADYLLSDGLITDEQYRALTQADAIFRSYRNRRMQISRNLVEKLDDLKTIFLRGP